jgi:hypothetical protein
MTNPFSGRRSPDAGEHRFTKPLPPFLTRADLELYATELNQRSLTGWYVASEEQVDGSHKPTLLRMAPGRSHRPRLTAVEMESNERWLNSVPGAQMRSMGLKCGALIEVGGKVRYVSELR